MYKLTALLNLASKTAYLSGNNNCVGTFSHNEMYNIAKGTDGLSPTSPYVLWANSLNSIADFEFCVFYSESETEVLDRATRYAQKMGCTSIDKGRVTLAVERE
ncbi:hypothetical protein VV869_18495 [Photobacterium sp. MCCC 1A19761]|uniref:hypothetical protein n=1 Tax=Photobacterium sp. MCCC 1A19761 TaxID=3115000 RepID=UPI00307F395D